MGDLLAIRHRTSAGHCDFWLPNFSMKALELWGQTYMRMHALAFRWEAFFPYAVLVSNLESSICCRSCLTRSPTTNSPKRHTLSVLYWIISLHLNRQTRKSLFL